MVVVGSPTAIRKLRAKRLKPWGLAAAFVSMFGPLSCSFHVDDELSHLEEVTLNSKIFRKVAVVVIHFSTEYLAVGYRVRVEKERALAGCLPR